jgi:hypothetical protein
MDLKLGEEVVFIQLETDKSEIGLIPDKNDVINFNTLPGHAYLILRKNNTTQLLKTIFTSTENTSSKYFHEAMLGKERNF